MITMIPNHPSDTRFLEHIPTRLEVAEQHKRAGGMVAAVLPIHYPRELLRAFNIHPIEVWGPPNIDPTSGVTHLQPYVCSLVRNALSFLEIGGMDVVDLVIVPHACDSLQGLASVLLDFSQPRQSVLPFYLPRGDGGGTQKFLINEIQNLSIRFEQITQITPTNEEMLEAVRLEELADNRMSELLRDRRHLPITDHNFYRLLRAREFLPIARFLEITSMAIEKRIDGDQDGIRLMISGIVPEPMTVFDLISEFGGIVVADDLACSSRRAYPVGKSEDPFTRMAERLLGGPPDWNKGSPIEQRLSYLLNLADEQAVEGVIFCSVKFCEPELFDLPELRNGLQDHDLPSIHIEVDLNDILSSETLTQIEAFLEMIL
jgi:benzoyl-CoA reductase/2-hydroxyglutaryl-CoA dehydratase subunit BcrC/BadD/HgdB